MLTDGVFAPWLGVFETVRVEEGVPLFLEEHWASLKKSAHALHLAVPPSLPATALPNETGRWRWIVTAEGLRDFFQRDDSARPESFSLAVAPQRIGSHNWDAQFKTLSYLTHWQARGAVDADEAVLLNERGEIASGAMSNLFWIAEGKIYTPALETGCRAGVIRNWVLRKAAVMEGNFPAGNLDRASSVFVTNSWLGVMPVNRFCGQDLAINDRVLELKKSYAETISRYR